MKKIFAYPVAIASAAILFSACQATDLKVSVAEQDGVKVTIKAAADTRTYIGQKGDDICSFWNNGDVLGVWAGSVNSAPTAFTNGSADGEEASFTGTIPAFSGSTTLYAMFPQTRITAPTSTHPAVQVNFPGTQTPPTSRDSYDPNAEVLAAMPEAIDASEDGTIVSNMRFARLNSAIKVNVTGSLPSGVSSDETIQKFVFLAGETVDLANNKGVIVAGNMDITDDCELTGNWTAASNMITVTPASAVEFDDPIYFTVAPCVLPADTTLAFRFFTASHVITKEVKLSSAIDLSSGTFATFNVSLSGAVAAPLPSVISTSSSEGATWTKLAEDDYTVTINGSYLAENITKYDKVSYFFYYKINGGKQTLAEINYSYANSKTFSFDITGLHQNDYVTYITVARIGDSPTGNVKTSYTDPFYVDKSSSPAASIVSASTDYATAFKQADGKYTYTVHGSYVGEYLVENSAPCTYWFQGTGVRYNLNTDVQMPSNSGTLKAVIRDLSVGETLSYKTAIRLSSEVNNTTGIARSLTVGESLVEWDATYGKDSAVFYMEDMATPMIEFVNASGNTTVGFDLESSKFRMLNFKKNDYIQFSIPVKSYSAGTSYKFKCTLSTLATKYLTNFSITCRIGEEDWKTPTGLVFDADKDVPVSYPVSFDKDYTNTTIQVKLYVPTSNTAGKFFLGSVVSFVED